LVFDALVGRGLGEAFFAARFLAAPFLAARFFGARRAAAFRLDDFAAFFLAFAFLATVSPPDPTSGSCELDATLTGKHTG
jgi:hypothetical protein